MFVCTCVMALVAVLTGQLVYSDSGDDIELASCPHGQVSKDCSMVASCSCELLSEGEHLTICLQAPILRNLLINTCICRSVPGSREALFYSSRALQRPLSPLQGTVFYPAPFPHAVRALPSVSRGSECLCR